MSDSNTVLNLLREILRSDRRTTSERLQPTREELVRRDYENMFKLINEYQYTMTEYQNNMHTYLLLLSSLQLQMPSFAAAAASGTTETRAPPRTHGNGNGNRVNTAFRPMNSNPLPPVRPTTTSASASETRRMFESLVRTSPRTTDLSGSGVVPMTARVATTASSSGNSASPAVNLIDVVFEYDSSMLGNETDTAVQHLIDNDDFRNSILRAAGIEGGDNMMHWVMTPQYAGAEDEPRGLTNEEIYRNTELLIFREDLEGLLSNTCPITMEEYVVGDRLLQLRTCRHAFRERELVEWFQRECTCPVCRTSYG